MVARDSRYFAANFTGTAECGMLRSDRHTTRQRVVDGDAAGEPWLSSFDAVGRRIDRLLERLARGEADHPPGRNRRHRPGLGVAADARPLPMDLPRAKAAHDHGFPLP